MKLKPDTSQKKEHQRPIFNMNKDEKILNKMLMSTEKKITT